MRYRLTASYLGAPYQAAFGPAGDEVTLFAACPPPEELGFGSAEGHWRLEVGIGELDALRLARPAGLYRGERCLVLDDQGDRLHIAYLGEDPDQARQLGYWEIDREVFEMVVPRTDVTDLTEEQIDIPAAAAIIGVPIVSSAPIAMPGAPEPVTAGSVDEMRSTGPIPILADPAESLGPVPALSAPVASDYADVDYANVDYGDADYGDVAYGDVAYANGYQGTDRVAAWHGSPEPWNPVTPSPNGHHNGHSPNGSSSLNGSAQSSRQSRTSRRDRTPIQSVFDELLDLAAIPQSAYAVDDEVPGAMCLLKVEGGYEVFASSDDARLEVRFFEDEEAAYFYLFGVLAAEAVRNGDLGPTSKDPSRAAYTEHLENVSKYLRAKNGPKLPSGPVRVLIAGGADGPPLPKQPRRPLVWAIYGGMHH
jgi:hypothetical protein